MITMLEMLKNVELNQQDEYFKRIKEHTVICFLPSLKMDDLAQDIDVLQYLCSQGLQVAAICMFDEAMQLIDGFKLDFNIIPLSELERLKSKIHHVLIPYSKYVWPNAIYHYIEEKGMEVYFVCDSEYLKIKRHDCWLHVIDLYSVYSGFDDELSKKSFLSVIEWKMTGQPQNIIYADEPQYMLHGFTPYEKCIAIDGGAFDGETARAFSDLGADVYAFELDKKNFEIVENLSKRYNFHAINKGLWSCQKLCTYRADGAASVVDDDGDESVELIDIDTFVQENNLKRVDYIKLDVEGVEMNVLKGAVKTISKWKPIMAISAYHNDEDLYELYKYIKSIRPDYKFAFRYYKIDARNYYLDDYARNIFSHYDLDLMVPTPWEYVLYAR